MSVEGKQASPAVKTKPKKKSLVERELESSLTDKFIVPATISDKSLTSRYGRARRIKTDNDYSDTKKAGTNLKSLQQTKSPPVYRMHASNSPGSTKTTVKIEDCLDSQIENIFNDNIIINNIGETKFGKSLSPKIYIRKDLIQRNGKEENLKYVKNIFSPVTSTYTPSNSHLDNYFERSSEKYSLNKSQNNHVDMSSVVKTLDFDGNKKKKKTMNNAVKQNHSKSDIFEMEAKCVFQVGDLAWARMGTYPFWPCIITRDPDTGMFVKKKLFGRIERDIINVTFFGDNGRHSWVVDNMLRPYLGKTEFLDTRDKFSADDKKKDPRLYAAFFVSEKKQALWNMSVDEAETLLKEPKRLRIDLFNHMLWQSRALKVNSKKGGKVTRTDSDVSLSESLYDTLFSEDDVKDENLDRSRKKNKNKSLDVSDVVTACLDNMAAKTGITTIQKQSHMDRWLQKAKSKTPEKIQVIIKTEKGVELKSCTKNTLSRNTSSEESLKSSSDTSRNTSRDRLRQNRSVKTLNTKKLRTRSSRRLSRKSQEIMNNSLTSYENEHDYSCKFVENIENQSLVMNENDSVVGYVQTNGDTDSSCNVGTKVESFHDETNESSFEIETSVVNDDIIEHETVNVTAEISLDTVKSNNLTNGIELNCTKDDIIPFKPDSETEKEEICKLDEANEINETGTLKIVTDIEISKVTNNQMPQMETDDLNNSSIIACNLKVVENKYKEDNINDQENTELVVNTDVQIISDTVSENKEAILVDGNEDNHHDHLDSLQNNRKLNESFDKITNTEAINVNTDQNSKTSEMSPKLISIPSGDDKDDKLQYPSIEKITVETDIKNSTNNGLIKVAKSQSKHIEVHAKDFEFEVETNKNDNVIKQENNSKVLLNLHNTELSIMEGRVTSSPFEFTNTDKLSKVSSPDRFDDFDSESLNSESSEVPLTKWANKETKDFDTTSIKSNSSTSSSRSTRRNKNDKQPIDFNNIDISRVLEEPDFKKYLDQRQDQILDENPELSENEVIKYLYKTWIYEESSKSDKRITDDFDGSGVVKGLAQDRLASKPKRKVNKLYSNVKLETMTKSCDDSDSISKRSLRSRTSSPSEGSLRSNTSSPADYLFRHREPKLVLTKIEDENNLIHKDVDSEVASLDSESSDIPLIKHKIKKQKKAKVIETSKLSEETNNLECEKELTKTMEKTSKELKKINDAMECPKFIKYLEMKQDNITDEHPELTQDEIVFYLYKTWLYEEGSKAETNRVDEIEQENMVKGLNTDVQVNKVKKKVKTENRIDKCLVGTDEVKEKPKRNVVHPDYSEFSADIEEEIKYFSIFSNKGTKDKKMANENFNVQVTDDDDLESPKFEPLGETDTKANFIQHMEIEQNDVYNEVEQYFQNLTNPKPNLFRGLTREKVCEICEKPMQLVKCKGCHQMFHPDCVRKETEIVDVPLQLRGRKKKKKPRGRKPKTFDDSIESDGDEKNESNNSEEKSNMSIEVVEPIVADADNFEAQFQEMIKEIMDDSKNPYELFSANYTIDWTNSIAGNCEIIDVSPVLKIETDYSDFKCNNCQKADVPICYVCKSPVSPRNGVEERQKCQSQHCYKYYHLECLESWPQTQFTGDLKKKINEHFNTFTCPRHVCHTCVCDDPRGCKTRFNGEKLARCVRCPATYHTFTKCLPAGTQILSGSHIVCPRHYEHRPGKVPCHVNTGWCFICALGGTLICCEYCPTSFHAECLNIKPPEGGYMCEDCETGRLPLYGEMVWVKLGHYRWWPGMILHPSEIPPNIMAVRHSPGEFVVRFFGQYDHYWVNRGRVFPFQEGDSGRVSGQKSKIDAAFTMAMEHAQRACQILKNALPNHEESDIASSLLPPHYVKLKVNKPCGSLIGKRIDLEESSLTQCDCDPRESDPCGPYTHCLNRMLLTECGPSCKAGDRCQNRAFEKREYPKMVPYRTPHRGWGLKTLEDIKMGQFVIEYVGELLDEDEFRRRMAKMHEIRDENFYFLTLDKERMIDAGPKGNLARFMNHCCEPNCETQKWTVLGDVRVGLFALRDIPAGSEVTFNYNLECAGIDKKKCMCGAKLCSGYIGAKPKQDESQTKRLKRTYKKRPKQIDESPSTIKSKPKPRTTSRSRPKEMTELEKDLLIIKNATNGLSSDSESGRINSVDCDKVLKPLKRKRVSFSTDNAVILINSDGDQSQSSKRLKNDAVEDVGD